MDFDRHAQILKALGHPLRLKMVFMLLKDECCVTDVTNALQIPQSTSSQHLGVLKNAGVVSPVKYGTRTCYFVQSEVVKTIVKQLQEESVESS